MKPSEALKSVKTFHDWLIQAHGAERPLEQDIVDKFAEMQMESMDAVEQAIPIAQQMERFIEAYDAWGFSDDTIEEIETTFKRMVEERDKLRKLGVEPPNIIGGSNTVVNVPEGSCAHGWG